MSLRAFMFAADTLRLEEGIGFHVKTDMGVSTPPVPSPEDVKAQNANAMTALAGIMASVQGKRR